MSLQADPAAFPDLAERLAASARWRLAGLLFERPREGWREEVEALGREVDDAWLRQALVGARQASEGFYLRMLGPAGSVSPREVGHRPREDPGAILSRVKIFYEAFAFHPRAEDPMDHVAVEAGFLGYLTLKEAYAGAAGDAQALRTASEGRSKFLSQHLGPLAEALASALSPGPAGYLAPAAQGLVALAARTGPSRG